MGVCDDGTGARGGMMRVMEGRAEAVAGLFTAQEVANTMWAYATMGAVHDKALGMGGERSSSARDCALLGVDR